MQDGYTKEITGPESVRVLVAERAKPNRDVHSPLNRQFFESFLDVSTGEQSLYCTFPNLFQKHHKERKEGKKKKTSIDFICLCRFSISTTILGDSTGRRSFLITEKLSTSPILQVEPGGGGLWYLTWTWALETFLPCSIYSRRLVRRSTSRYSSWAPCSPETVLDPIPRKNMNTVSLLR